MEDLCDVCGGKLVSRADDTPEALALRLRDYYDKTAPVIEIFQRKEVVVHVDATAPKQQVFVDICAQLALPVDGD